MIDKNKKYKTRNGLPVVIYSTAGGGSYPVHGYVTHAGGETRCMCWTAEGYLLEDRLKIREQYDHDLVEVRETREFWAVEACYNHPCIKLCRNKENAESIASAVGEKVVRLREVIE